MRSKIVSATAGARPIDGSSSISNFGAEARPRPIATICCSPPDSVPASCVARSARIGNSVWMRSSACANGAAGLGIGAHLEVFEDRQRLEHLATFRHMGDAEMRA